MQQAQYSAYLQHAGLILLSRQGLVGRVLEALHCRTDVRIHNQITIVETIVDHESVSNLPPALSSSLRLPLGTSKVTLGSASKSSAAAPSSSSACHIVPTPVRYSAQRVRRACRQHREPRILREEELWSVQPPTSAVVAAVPAKPPKEDLRPPAASCETSKGLTLLGEAKGLAPLPLLLPPGAPAAADWKGLSL